MKGCELFNDEKDDGIELSKLNVNKQYSQKYEQWRTKEELSKMKSKYGTALSSDESHSDEDEVGEELTPEVENEFLKTYSLLKRKDKSIYDPKFVAFSSKSKTNRQKKKSNRDRPLTVKEAEYRQAFAEYTGTVDDNVCDDKIKGKYYDELEASKTAFINAAKNVEEEGFDFMTVNKKNKEDAEKEKEGYLLWLKGKIADLPDNSKDIKWLRQYWEDENLDEDEKFLRNYILERKYRIDENFIDPEDSFEFSEEEGALEQAEDFERNYNFRFEEPDKEFIKSYPRTIKSSIRKEDTRRKDKRIKYKERKIKEVTKISEEMKRMKALKRKEAEQRLSRIQDIAGHESVPLDIATLDNDFDPEEYDKKMGEIFDDEYYAEVERKKPVILDDDECFKDDCLFEYLGDEVEGDTPVKEKLSRRQRRKNKLKNAKKEADIEDDELGFEDVVAGIPCRFKYRSVIPNDFGLDTDEILKAEDKELNKWVSLKKMVQYRTDEQEKFDCKAYKKHRNNRKRKTRIIPSIFKEKINAEDTTQDEREFDRPKVDCLTDERLKAFGINPKRFKRKIKYSKSVENIQTY
ncbi:hypothetical protein GJ496_006876 [Pomphorhynchus laevis]|nr:hypothetical protein GJ496_006876 [Pomphorhynchus laevis]